MEVSLLGAAPLSYPDTMLHATQQLITAADILTQRKDPVIKIKALLFQFGIQGKSFPS
jgi:hypothetical protein